MRSCASDYVPLSRLQTHFMQRKRNSVLSTRLKDPNIPIPRYVVRIVCPNTNSVKRNIGNLRRFTAVSQPNVGGIAPPGDLPASGAVGVPFGGPAGVAVLAQR